MVCSERSPRESVTIERSATKPAAAEVVDLVRYLLRLPDNVKIGPEVLVRTMRNPMAP